MFVDSLGYVDGKVLVSDEGINLRYTDGKVLIHILGDVDRITLLLDVGTYMGSLDGSFDGYNDVNLDGLLF